MTNEEFEEHQSRKIRDRAQLPRLVEMIFYIVVSLTFGVGFIWWNEGPPMVVVERHLLTPEVSPGDQITIFNSVVATKQCPVEISRFVVDSIGVIYSLTPETLWPDERVGSFEYSSTVTVPTGASLGPAIYRVRAEWRCNPLQKLLTPEIQLNDVEVEIVK